MSPLSTRTPGNRRSDLVTALLGIVADRGLDEVSVREVARAAEVSIGSVQHYFPTKDAMLLAAFEAVVERIRTRVEALPFGGGPRENLRSVLRELLPLDERRANEVRLQVAFASRAAVTPDLAVVQRRVLDGLRSEIAEAVRDAGDDPRGAESRAQLLIAATDGLGLHAVSAPGWVSSGELEGSLELLLDAVVPG